MNVHYFKQPFSTELLELIVTWAKALKIGSNDLAYYRQTGEIGTVIGLLRSTQDIAGVRMAYPIKEGDTKFPFDTSLFGIQMDLELVVGINELSTFWEQFSKSERELNIESVATDLGQYPVSFVTNMERFPFMTQDLGTVRYTVDYVFYAMSHFKTIEFFDVTENEVFQDIMKLKSAEGSVYFQTPEGYILTVWPGLIKANKGDQVLITIKDDPFQSDTFYVCYTVTKPKKHYRTETVLRCIQPKHLI